MRNSNRGKYTPYVRPIQRIELSEANVKGRLILIVVLLALAVVAIATGMMSVLRPELGWNQIEAQAKGVNCSQEFSFHYDFTDVGSDASAQKKALTALYSAACEDAFYIFNADLSAERQLAAVGAQFGWHEVVKPSGFEDTLPTYQD